MKFLLALLLFVSVSAEARPRTEIKLAQAAALRAVFVSVESARESPATAGPKVSAAFATFKQAVAANPEALARFAELNPDAVAKTPTADLLLAFRNGLLDAFSIEAGPSSTLRSADTLYASQCAACHGATGKGDGALAAKVPGGVRSFLDPARREIASPFLAFNQLLDGVPNSAMPAFKDKLAADEVWDLAFLVAKLRREPTSAQVDGAALIAKGLSLAQLARDSDGELRTWLTGKTPDVDAALSWARRQAPYLKELPRQK